MAVPRCDGCGDELDAKLDVRGWPANICYACAWDPGCGSPLAGRPLKVVRERAEILRQTGRTPWNDPGHVLDCLRCGGRHSWPHPDCPANQEAAFR